MPCIQPDIAALKRLQHGDIFAQVTCSAHEAIRAPPDRVQQLNAGVAHKVSKAPVAQFRFQSCQLRPARDEVDFDAAEVGELLSQLGQICGIVPGAVRPAACCRI